MKASQLLYFRRCHVCNEITIEKKELSHCSSCRKAFVPFLFFDEKKTSVLQDNETRPMRQESYLPIRGLTSYW